MQHFLASRYVPILACQPLLAVGRECEWFPLIAVSLPTQITRTFFHLTNVQGDFFSFFLRYLQNFRLSFFFTQELLSGIKSICLFFSTGLKSHPLVFSCSLHLYVLPWILNAEKSLCYFSWSWMAVNLFQVYRWLQSQGGNPELQTFLPLRWPWSTCAESWNERGQNNPAGGRWCYSRGTICGKSYSFSVNQLECRCCC